MLHQNDPGIPLWLTKLCLFVGPRSQRQDWHPIQRRYEEESPRHAQKTPGAGSVQRATLLLEPVALPDGRARYGAKTSETSNESRVHVSNKMDAIMLLTLVACLNITNGRFFRVAASCSAPIMIPLSMRTALDRKKISKVSICIRPVLT